MTLAVLGLDAADPRLANAFECENLLLSSHAPLESFALTRDTPLTAEVWPVIATGSMPEESDRGTRGSDWTGSVGILERLAKQFVPKRTRSTIGRYLRLGKPGAEMFGDVDENHVFAPGAVFNWPGLTPTRTWKRAEYWLEKYHDGTIDDFDFLRRQLAFTGQEVGWLASMSQVGFPIVGVHAHILDHAGHAWARQPEKLERTYQHVDRLAGVLRNHPPISELVVLSDHGMQTVVTNDDSPGHHSFEGMVASTFEDENLPADVTSVRDWLGLHTPSADPVGDPWSETTFDTPTEHLRELGYLD